MDTSKKTVAEFDKELLDINNQRDALAEKANALRKERDLAFAQETIEAKVANMGEAEREAMRRALAAPAPAPAPAQEAAATPAPGPDQTVQAHGIGSNESVGNFV